MMRGSTRVVTTIENMIIDNELSMITHGGSAQHSRDSIPLTG
jgi:hypothetical protein